MLIQIHSLITYNKNSIYLTMKTIVCADNILKQKATQYPLKKNKKIKVVTCTNTKLFKETTI